MDLEDISVDLGFQINDSLPFLLSQASVPRRCDVMKSTAKKLKEGIGDGEAKILLLSLTHALSSYCDTKSISALQELIRVWCAADAKQAGAVLMKAMSSVPLRLPYFTRDLSRTGLAVFTSSLTLMSCLSDMFLKTAPAFSALVSLQSAAFAAAVSWQGLPRLRRNAKKVSRFQAQLRRRFVASVGEGAVPRYLDALLGAPSLSPWDAPFLSFLVSLQPGSSPDSLPDSLPRALDRYVEALFLAKSSAHPHLLATASHLITQTSSHDLFSSKVLPGIRRAALRTPEFAVHAFSEALSQTPLDLSRYSGDLLAILGPLLASTNPTVNEGAVGCWEAVFPNVSDSAAKLELLTGLVKVLGGAHGKLTAYQHRVMVLRLVEGMAAGCRTEDLALSALSQLQSYMSSDTNEAAQIQTLSAIGRWSESVVSDIPKATTDFFKAGVVGGATSHTRSAFLLAGDSLYEADTMPFLELLEDDLGWVMGKCSPATPLSLVEGFLAGYLLLKLLDRDLGVGEFEGIKSQLLTPSILSATSTKVLPALNESEGRGMVGFLRLSLLNHSSELAPTEQEVLVGLLLEIALTKPYSNRSAAFTALRQVLARNHSLSSHVITHLQRTVASARRSEEDPEAVNRVIRFVREIFAGITSSLPTEGREKCVLDSLLLLHSSALQPEGAGLFTAVTQGIDLYRFGEQYREEILALVQETRSAETYLLVTSLSRHCLTLISPLVVRALDEFEGGALRAIDMEDLEIHRTPAGTLWKVSLLEEFEKSMVVDKNVKRESKLYSVADQKWAEEMEAKLKKQQGLKLTKKQQDQLDERLAVEAGTRAHVDSVMASFTHQHSILMSCLEADVAHLMHNIARIASVTMTILLFPVSARDATTLLQKLTLKVFPASFRELASLMGRLSVRLHDPPCAINPDWLGEPLDQAFGRCIGHFRGMLSDGFTLSSASFSLAFPLLRYVVASMDMTEESYEGNAVIALDVILAHVRKRATTENLFDGPSFMPLPEILRLACATFERKPVGPVGNRLLALLDEVCTASSGEEGCAVAGEGELTVLVHFLCSSHDVLRSNVLLGMQTLAGPLALQLYESSDVRSLANRLSSAVWLAMFDEVDAVKKCAAELWSERKCKFTLHPGVCNGLLLFVVRREGYLQSAAATAITEALRELDESIDEVLQNLMSMYGERYEPPRPILDEMGRVLVEASADAWEERAGIAGALHSLVPILVNEQLLSLVSLIVPRGLSDHSPVVQGKMRDVGIHIINVHGKLVIDVLLPVFEGYLDNTPDSQSNDVVKQNVVILMATLAKHLSPTDPKVKPIVCKLMEALSTPSEQVQAAVAQCLAPLVPAIKDLAPALIQRILYQLLESEKYGERRGAAYGLSGLVKGLGLLSLKQMEIMPALIEAIQNKKNPQHREGALMAFEQLCSTMGTLFEPYVINVLPHLLVCFGDGNQYVRQATEKASKAIMGKLSAHGVKLVLPSLLKALEDDAWRTKCGSVELLGAMAFCNPRQLSSCLPSIVPRLIEVMADSHTKVQRSGLTALTQIGSVIRNPEIQAIVKLLLDALYDPTKHTDKCLEGLMRTSFVHKIDAPSLALIVPVVTRSFNQRTETKKAAAQIIGNMLVLTEEKDLKPYLDSIIPGLKSGLLDPVPDVRLYSARALGCLVKGIGEIAGLMEWLLATLISEQSSVDRSGAAQGISEVMAGLSEEKLDTMMREILQCLQDEDLLPHIREGYLLLFIYLPITMKERFAAYIGLILNPILSGLASESEFVRNTSYKAGQRTVQQYADSAISLFLPRLEEGLFHDNYRIRLASCQLLGDLLYKVMGVTGKQSTVTGDEDDNFGTDETKKMIIGALGPERRNRVFSGLYMARSDVALAVRQAGLHIWKIVVTNTPKTLKEILPVLIELILSCLASEVYDKRAVANRTLEDLVKKLGDRILPEVIPILESSLHSEDITQRQGVCLGLSKIISDTSRDQVEDYSDKLLPAIRAALTDPAPEVRNAAAGTFAKLHDSLGPKALDEILSPLLANLESLQGERAEYLIGALKEIMRAKSRVVLPYMVPKLVQKPVNIGALASLASVAGEALYEHLDTVISATVGGLCEVEESEVARELEHANLIISSISDDDGHDTILEILTEMLTDPDTQRRRYSALLFGTFCGNEHLQIEEHVVAMWRALLGRFSDPDPEVVKTCWTAFNTATKRLSSEDMVRLVPDLRTCVGMAVENRYKRDTTYTLPGFCLPKGIAQLVLLYRDGILNGSPELKEQAIIGLREAIQLTDAPALKPSVVQITGPLIRVLGERYSTSVKMACLDTLSLLIDKVKVALKPFLSQLQTTFMKSLNDTSRDVRSRGVTALTKLVTLHSKVDNLFTDILNGTKNDNLSTRETMFAALHGTMFLGGSGMSPNLQLSIANTLKLHLGAPEDSIRTANGACFGALATFYGEEGLVRDIRETVLGAPPSSKEARHGRVLALAGLARYATSRLQKLELVPEVGEGVVKALESDNVQVCNAATFAASRLIAHLQGTGEEAELLDRLVGGLATNCAHPMADIRLFATSTVHQLSVSGSPPLSDTHTRSLLVPLLDSSTKKAPPGLRPASELAIATLLRLKTDTELADRVSSGLDAKSADVYGRFLPTAKRVAADSKTYTTVDNDIFASLAAV